MSASTPYTLSISLAYPYPYPAGTKTPPLGMKTPYPAGIYATPWAPSVPLCGDLRYPVGTFGTPLRGSTLPPWAPSAWRAQACVFLFFFFQAAFTFFFSNHFFCFYIIQMFFFPTLWSKPYTKILLEATGTFPIGLLWRNSIHYKIRLGVVLCTEYYMSASRDFRYHLSNPRTVDFGGGNFAAGRDHACS